MTYARHQFTVQDRYGNILPGAEITVQEEASGFPLATLFLDLNGTEPAGNPVYSDEDGLAYFHADGGQYKVTIRSGTYSKILRYVQVGVAAGEDGATPGIKYTYSATTADSDPGPGIFRLNSTTLSDVTEAYLDIIDATGANVSAYLDTFDDGGQSSERGILELRCLSDQSKFGVYRLTGTVTGTTYRKFSLEHIASAGPLSGEAVFGFTRAGADGADGADGTDGADGADGADGITPAITLAFDSATSGDPGAGKFGFSNADLTIATGLRIDNVDAFGADISAYVDSFASGGNSSDRGQVEFRDISDASKFYLGKVTGSVTDSTGYRTLVVAHIASSGPMSGNCAMTFTRTGNTGASGLGTGTVNPTGTIVANRIAVFDDTSGEVIKDGGAVISTDGTFAANSDAKVSTEKAVKAYVDAAITAIKAGVSASFDTLVEIATELGNKISTSAIGVSVQAYNAATALTNAAQQWTRPQRYSATALTASTAWDASTSARLTAAVSTAFQIANPTGGTPIDGQFYHVEITYSGSGPVTWGSQFKGLSAITWTNTSGKKDRATFQWNATNTEMEYVGHSLDVRA